MMPSIIAISAGSSAPNPASTSAASRTAQGWASGAGQLSAAMPGSSRTSASLCATTASASSSSHCSRLHASSWLQDASPRNCENHLLGILGRIDDYVLPIEEYLARNYGAGSWKLDPSSNPDKGFFQAVVSS